MRLRMICLSAGRLCAVALGSRAHLVVVDGHIHGPVQDGRQCSLTWLKLEADAPENHITEITNEVADCDGDVKDFHRSVHQFLLPVSSVDSGNELIAQMRAFARSCTN